jgi:cation:H+ antiporter
MGISEHTIGLTIVAFGTSMPELAVSSIAAYQGHIETAWGNIIGSNITNIFLVLGVAMICISLKPSKYALKDSISMLAVSLITLVLVFDGTLQYYDGILLIVLYIVFVSFLRKRRIEEETRQMALPTTLAPIFLVIGALGVMIGADTVVKGAVSLSNFLGIAEATIAASIVAFGTSLPELMVSLVAVFKKRHGIAIGNVIGSNLINLCLVLGLASVLRGITISLLSTPIIFFIVSAAVIPLILKKELFTRKTGFIFLVFYVLFLLIIYIFQ